MAKPAPDFARQFEETLARRREKDKALFVGRREELEEFSVRLAEYETKKVWVIHGIGGVGKSWLLERLADECEKKELRHTLVEFGPSKVSDQVALLRGMAKGFGWHDEVGWSKFIERSQRLEELEAQRESLFRRISEGARAVVEAMPGANALHMAAGELWAQLARGLEPCDQELLTRPHDLLKEALLEDYQKWYTHQTHPIILLLDAYERADSPIDELLRHLVLYLPNALFVVTSREPIKWMDRKEDGNAWRELNTIVETKPKELEAKEIQVYLDKRSIEGTALRERIAALTRGFPQLLALACDVVVEETKTMGKEPSADKFPLQRFDAVKITEFLGKCFLGRLPSEREHLKEVILKGGLCRWVNREALAHLMKVNSPEAYRYLMELLDYSFIIPIGSGIIIYHDAFRDAVLAWWKDSPRESLDIHRYMHDYHMTEWQERGDANYLREALFHHVQFEPGKAMQTWSSTFNAAYQKAVVPLCEALFADLKSYRLRKETVSPNTWGAIQTSIGVALCILPTGSSTDNLLLAIGCFESALQVFKKDRHPREWGIVKNNIGNALKELSSLREDNNLRRAIDFYKEALEVLREESFPVNWAMTQSNLGEAYRNLHVGERKKNILEAIDCFNNSLRVYTKDRYPHEWALAKNNLGIAWCELPAENHEENLSRGFVCFNEALQIFEQGTRPLLWALVQGNMAVAYIAWADIKEGENKKNLLEQALEHIHNSLTVFSETTFPREYKKALNNLEIVQRRLASL